MPASAPLMILYHFLNHKFALKDLRERRLKLADIASLNDPFDFMSLAAPTKAERRLVREWRLDIAKDFGLVCLSRDWHNPVQWAHYADSHKGVCLGFEVDDVHLRQVSYVQSRPAWPTARQPWPISVKQRVIDQLLYSKFTHWSYEDEYRFFTTKHAQDEYGHFYVDFSEELRLKRVIVGARSTLTRAEVKAVLGDLWSDIDAFKVRLAFRDFRIVKQKKAAEWL